jgi:hypothetical protein
MSRCSSDARPLFVRCLLVARCSRVLGCLKEVFRCLCFLCAPSFIRESMGANTRTSMSRERGIVRGRIAALVSVVYQELKISLEAFSMPIVV